MAGRTARPPPNRAPSEATLRDLCDPVLARTVSAIIHDTVSVGIVAAGVKYTSYPRHRLHRDRLPDPPRHRRAGHARGAAAAVSARSCGRRMDIECEQVGPFRFRAARRAALPAPRAVLRDHDAAAVPLPFLAPFATMPSTGPHRRPDIRLLTVEDGPRRRPSWLSCTATHERVSVEALRFACRCSGTQSLRFCAETGSADLPGLERANTARMCRALQVAQAQGPRPAGWPPMGRVMRPYPLPTRLPRIL